MNSILFNDLAQSLKEANVIAHGETEASRRIKVTPPTKNFNELRA